MNEKLKNISENIREKTNIPQEEKFGSVIAILMIISIILTVVRVIQECNKNKLSSNCTFEDKKNLYGEQIRSYSQKRGWFTKLRIKKIIRKNMSKEQYNKYGESLLNSILNTGEYLKDDEITTLMEAANV